MDPSKGSRRKAKKSSIPGDYALIHHLGKVFKVKFARANAQGLLLKHSVCYGYDSQRCGQKLVSREIYKGFFRHEIRGDCICDLGRRSISRNYIPDPRERLQLCMFPPSMNEISTEKYHSLLEGVRKAKRLLALTGSSMRDRFYVPDLYAPRLPVACEQLKGQLEKDLWPIIEQEKRKHPLLQHHRVMLIGSEPNAGIQAKPHYDFPDTMKAKQPEQRGISLLVAIDGFDFCYLAHNNRWAHKWVGEGEYMAFTGECLHFGGRNPFNRPILRGFVFMVASPSDFPGQRVFSPCTTDYPEPNSVYDHPIPI